MVAPQWNESLATGNIRIDAQHRTLFSMVFNLHNAILAGTRPGALGPVLESLTKYTIEYFAHEERLMRSHNYYGYAEHKRKHDELVEQARGIISQFKLGALDQSQPISKFLGDWITHHIEEEDKALIRWMSAAQTSHEVATHVMSA